MRRRDFLKIAAGSAVATALTPGPLRAQAGAGRARKAAPRFDEEAIAKIERHLPALMRERSVPGVGLGVVHDGRLVWQRGFGRMDASSPAPVDDHTVFEAASVSKTVFAYAALKLCEHGVLALDTPLIRYTRKPFVEGDARIERVTARHALSHTTGFPDWRTSLALKLEAEPGARFLYSGEGYYYLQSVITELAGNTFDAPRGRYEADFEVGATDFDAFMRRSLLDPLGMTASGYLWRDGFEGRAARPHGTRGEPLVKKKPNAADVARYGAVGELRTTVSDYAKFLIAVLTLPPGDALLTAAMRDEMIRPQTKLGAEKIDGADSWALGWAIQERPTGHVILHSGGQSGFRSLTMASVERRSGFVIFTNSDNGGYVCYDPVLGELLTPLLAG
ncbi:MAG TPA: serine hydrolase domain-containing protein [Opitutaceae bacterium]|nr:serine hydrolase domain-containing protein [Opitutaceae bacterium]